MIYHRHQARPLGHCKSYASCGLRYLFHLLTGITERQTGSTDSITDITTAAGWEILDCQKDALSQDIRLVCTGGESECDHLYQSIGAVGKIARLPERCGQNAFAHISRAWVPEDQSIPENIARRLVRRGGVQPEVKALHIDTDFASADTSQIGTVSFTIQAANVPGAAASVPPTSLGARGKRQFGFIKKAISAVKQLNDLSLDESITLPPLNVDKTFNVLDQELACPPLEARLKLDVSAKAHAVAAIGVAAEGTIIPPKIDDFAITATLNAALNGAVNLTGGLTGSIDSGRISVFQIGIPGLDFPGILTIGPSFQVDVQANADLDVNADVSVGINYKIEKASLVFPPSSDKAQAQGGSFKLNDTPLKLAVSPALQATGTLEAHLIPSLNLGIEALGGVADATVFLELDASAAMRLSLEGRAEAAITVNRTSSRKNAIGNIREFAESSSPNRVVGRAIAMRQAAASGSRSGVSVTPSTGASFGGCFEILAGLGVNAGARANFFGLFDEETVVPLFNREFELFKRCFGDQAGSRRRNFRFARSDVFSARSVPEPMRLMKRQGLECPAADAPPTESLVDQVVAAASAIQLP
ncbi:hypothetical protein EST38_g5798 [Candolleomyces aberdarensis]|uniref:DUF7223 domain-containing protein n=1 Tax=Candolleomyces aberdarensis TaxID=2316362 RepID=A0A4Q2DLK6_9AGAR|nr:hypothetical protein EST38_g5798 [Candolleomyces aberdarensis]